MAASGDHRSLTLQTDGHYLLPVAGQEQVETPRTAKQVDVLKPAFVPMRP